MAGKVITIDGPAGSGKSTIAKLLAAELGFVHFDSGAIYRAITLHFIRMGYFEISLWDSHVSEVPLSVSGVNGKTSVRLNGLNVDAEIRSGEISNFVSPVSASIPVRQRVNQEAAKFTAIADLVADGRDMGSVVFPDATVKFYLDASPDMRARRRQLEDASRGRSVSFDTILSEQQRRDENDRTKPWGALVVAKGAIVVDTTLLSIEEVYAALLKISQGRLTLGR